MRPLRACMLAFLALLTLGSAVHAQSAGVAPDEVLWRNIRDTSVPELFEMFVRKYPESPHRSEAEARLAAIRGGAPAPSASDQAEALLGGSPVEAVAPEPPTVVRSLDPAAPPVGGAAEGALTPALVDEVDAAEQAAALAFATQQALAKVGCEIGTPDGQWGARSRAAATEFLKRTGQVGSVEAPTPALLEAIEGADGPVCRTSVATIDLDAVAPRVIRKKPAERKAVAPRLTPRRIVLAPKRIVPPKRIVAPKAAVSARVPKSLRPKVHLSAGAKFKPGKRIVARKAAPKKTVAAPRARKAVTAKTSPPKASVKARKRLKPAVAAPRKRARKPRAVVQVAPARSRRAPPVWFMDERHKGSPAWAGNGSGRSSGSGGEGGSSGGGSSGGGSSGGGSSDGGSSGGGSSSGGSW